MLGVFSIHYMQNFEKIEFILKELIHKNNFEPIPEVFSAKYIVHTSKKDYSGHSIIKRWVRDLNQFFYDLKIVKIQFLVQTDNIIVWKRTLKGKIKLSKNKNLTPGSMIKWDELIVSSFHDGLIQEEWINSEFLGALHSKMGTTKR